MNYLHRIALLLTFGLVVSANATPAGQVAYTTLGSYTWTAPAGVTSVCVVCVGGGAGSGGGGGALAYRNLIAVTPGQTATITVGAGGNGGGSVAQSGGASSFMYDGASVIANGGSVSGPGGAPAGTYSGGGSGGAGIGSGHNTGGGAGGYSGNGGSVDFSISSPYSKPGTGGGGGSGNYPYSAGGGVGIFGQGSNGAAGGGGGSGGGVGYGFGGLFGGAGAGLAGNDGFPGGGGAVRIIWGDGRAFPSTNTQDLITPVITSSPAPAAGVGNPFSHQITTSPVATSYTATGLPAGLTLNSATGLIGGTATTLGNYAVALWANNAQGPGSIQSFVLSVVTPQSQTITFGPIGAQISGGAPMTLSATASSGLPVAYTVVSGPATVVGHALYLTGAGTGVVAADQAGVASNANYFPASTVSQSFTVTSVPFGQVAYTTPGTYQWTCPAGVTSVSAVCVGGGDYGGGGLGWKNNIPVSPGNTYTVVVGPTASPMGSYFISPTTVRGAGASDSQGGGFVGDGGGAGGDENWIGGGGAGGYAGKGGDSNTAGSGGGGGGGYHGDEDVNAGGGGGVGLGGLGGSGASGTGDSPGGGAGSGGSEGGDHEGGSHGGGGNYPASGGVRIIWGHGRAFPAAYTQDAVIPSITGIFVTSAPVGGVFNYQIQASPSVTTYAATGLPAGLTLNPVTGLITGTATAADTYSVTLSASNPFGTANPVTLIAVIEGGSSVTGQVAYLTPGAYNWTVPPGVNRVSVVCVGGGAGSGGGGGALGYRKDILVTPGQIATIVVGAGGASGLSSNSAVNGAASSFSYGGGAIITAGGGSSSGAGGAFSGIYVGGGYGGRGAGLYGGGGGAGGYAGSGGGAAPWGSPGYGGSGAGGGSYSNHSAGSGGGVGLMGQGADGVANGGGGSGGAGGAPFQPGGAYGGAGSGASDNSATSGTFTTAGGGGAVRIIWGGGRSFPSTYTQDVAVVAVAIMAQPSDLLVYPAHTATFRVTATGTPTPAYQWTKNGTPISGAIASTYSIANAQSGDAGTYAVIVSNPAGSVTSANATLTVGDVVAPTAPTGLNYADKTATTVTLVWHASTDNFGVTGYNIYRDGSSTALATTSELTFTDSGLSANTAYSYIVKAFDAAGNLSTASNTLSVTTTQDFSADSDHDGIPNATETALGTNGSTAANPDTTNQTQQNIHRPTR